MFWTIEYATRLPDSQSTTASVGLLLFTAGVLLMGIVWIVYEQNRTRCQNNIIAELIRKELARNAVEITLMQRKLMNQTNEKIFYIRNTIMLLGEEYLEKMRKSGFIFNRTKRIQEYSTWILLYGYLNQIQKLSKNEIISETINEEVLVSLCKSYLELYNTIKTSKSPKAKLQ
jgi:hypothetical protein